MADELALPPGALGNLVNETYYGVTLTTSRGESLVRASMVSRGGGSLRTTRGRVKHALPIRGTRTWAQIRQDGCDEYLLIAPRSGVLILNQFGRACRLERGLMALIAVGSPYEFERIAAGEIAVHHLPSALVREVMPDPEALCARPFASTHGVGDAVRSLCASAWREVAHLDETERRLLVHNIVALVGAALRAKSGRQGAPATAGSASPFTRALHYIGASLDDPDLSPAKIAAAIGVSRSYLHECMRRHDTSVGETLRHSRLEQCASDLRSEACRDSRVSTIAYRWGFNDPAHFSRAFRARFGCSPTEYRRHAG